MIGRSAIRLVLDDDGQDLVEYALLTGIFAAATMALFPPIVTEMAAAYARWQSGAEAVWEPSPPCCS